MQDLRTKRHVVHSLHLHLVFATRYRREIFSMLMMERLKYHFERMCEDFGCRLIEMGGERDQSCPPAGGTPAAYYSIKACQQPQGSILKDAQKRIPLAGKALLERGIMVTQLFHCFMRGCSTGDGQRIH